MMRSGAVFINLSRGHVVDLDALAKYLKNGHLQGAAVDVYPKEPKVIRSRCILSCKAYPTSSLHLISAAVPRKPSLISPQYVPRQVIDYVNTGASHSSVNFPPIQLPVQRDVHRLIHIHRNVPGVLSRINQILAQHDINISGQYLKTNEDIGYVITDINRKYTDAVLEEMKGIEGTIKFRVLY